MNENAEWMLWNFVLDALKGGRSAAFIAVAAHEKGSPGKTGFKMAFTADKQSVGTIGGGIMEFSIREQYVLQLKNGKTGSLTIGGSVSPAGGNFVEPVTQASLAIVGALRGSTRGGGCGSTKGDGRSCSRFSRERAIVQSEIRTQGGGAAAGADAALRALDFVGDDGLRLVIARRRAAPTGRARHRR